MSWGGWIVPAPAPNEIDVPPSISVGTATEEAEARRDGVHNSQSHAPGFS